MRKILILLKIITEIKKPISSGFKQTVTLSRLNPYNPISYLCYLILIIINIIVYGWKGVTEMGNQFKYK